MDAGLWQLTAGTRNFSLAPLFLELLAMALPTSFFGVLFCLPWSSTHVAAFAIVDVHTAWPYELDILGVSSLHGPWHPSYLSGSPKTGIFGKPMNRAFQPCQICQFPANTLGDRVVAKSCFHSVTASCTKVPLDMRLKRILSSPAPWSLKGGSWP